MSSHDSFTSYLLSHIYYLLSIISYLLSLTPYLPTRPLALVVPPRGDSTKAKKGRLDLRKHLRTISTDHVRICLTCAQSLCVKEHLQHPNTMGYGMLRKKGILSVEHIKSPRRRLSCITAVDRFKVAKFEYPDSNVSKASI